MVVEERWCVVTGGRGFAARHLVEKLIAYDMFSVRIADLGPTIDLEPTEEKGPLGEALRSGRAVYVQTDLRNQAHEVKACEGAEVVFHMAAPNSSINNYHLHHSVNVEGTKNVIDACIELKVKRLIYTSSPSVFFDGIHAIFNGDESLSYPAKHNNAYSATKAEGEALVIKSNGTNGLLTCCIRPSGIFGPGDKLFVPSLVAAARAGKSKFIIGDGNNIYDFTYVENVAHAHICAERALASEGMVAEKAAGQAYFVTNMEPIRFWEFVSLIQEGLGYEGPRIKIPAFVAMPIAHMVEWTYRLIRLLSCSRSFNCSKAKALLGYEPIVSLQDGIKMTIESYSHLRAEHLHKREGPSRVSVYLGSGRVADMLLWRDKRQTITALLLLVAIYYNFIASGFILLSGISKLLLATSIFLFIHGVLPEKIMGYTVEKIPPSRFHLSEKKLRRVASSVASTWNAAVNVLKYLSMGKDWVLFLKVFTSLRIDSLVLGTLSLGCKLKSDVVKKFVTSKKSD
ncbi:hypothetical protein CIPAW_04G076700 [Carya illinoinensis]|uniref:Reticulon-like protein n=1 Tax=Carya illinoinensis TaxID=32201 RepID=A0A8T1QQX3_CARIL|nr:hypothetical protein CIPAW_04G076700 [Carya illinoinensis]